MRQQCRAGDSPVCRDLPQRGSHPRDRRAGSHGHPGPHAGAGARCGRANQRDAGAGGRHPEPRHDLDAADKTITWTSADESVATIDDSGVITTHAPGQTTITAASTAGGVSTTYNLVVQEVVKCSYCGGTGHTSDTCAVKKTAEQQTAAVAAQQQAAAQAAEQAAAAQAAEQPADPGYAVTAKGDRIYPEGSPDIPEGGVVQRPDGTFYVKGPRNVIFGYEEGEPDPNMPPWTCDCVFCGDFGHDVYHCPILDAQENPDAFLMD